MRFKRKLPAILALYSWPRKLLPLVSHSKYMTAEILDSKFIVKELYMGAMSYQYLNILVKPIKISSQDWWYTKLVTGKIFLQKATSEIFKGLDHKISAMVVQHLLQTRNDWVWPHSSKNCKGWEYSSVTQCLLGTRKSPKQKSRQRELHATHSVRT